MSRLLIVAVSDSECDCTECGKKIARGQNVCYDSNDYRFAAHSECMEENLQHFIISVWALE